MELPNYPIIYDELICNGDEDTVWDCPSNDYTDHNCVNWENAVLICLGNT